jgi:hypothetical protein
VKQASVTVKEGESSAQSNGLQLQLQAQTVGVVRSLFTALDDQFTSHIDPVSALPWQFEKRIRQGARRVDSTITFDRKARMAEVDGKRIQIDRETRDVVALLYHIRTLDLSSGKQHKLAGIFDDKPFMVLVNAERKMVIETAGGPVEAIEVALRSEETVRRKKRINDDNHLRLWLSNDEKRTPVLITARPPFGEVRVRLTKPEA